MFSNSKKNGKRETNKNALTHKPTKEEKNMNWQSEKKLEMGTEPQPLFPSIPSKMNLETKDV